MLFTLELAIAGVLQSAVVAGGKEPIAADRQIQVIAGGLDVSLGELLGDFLDGHTVAHGGGAHAGLSGGEQVAKLGARAFEAHRPDVGKIVGRHREILVGGVEACEGDIE